MLMKPKVKPLVSRLNPYQLCCLCNEKMIAAARDLAEFTKHGINANFIVSLAHKCEKFENMLNESLGRQDRYEMQHLERELLLGLSKICEIGKRIWQHVPRKHSVYHVPELSF